MLARRVTSPHGLPCSEPEPFVSLTFVKNDSYEKGNDLVVVHVYVKEIHKETSKVLFREQDFTLVFQTRYERALGWHRADAELLAAARPLCLFTSSHLLLISLQRRKLPSPPPWLRAPHGVPVAGEAQVWSQISSQHRGEGAELEQDPVPAGHSVQGTITSAAGLAATFCISHTVLHQVLQTWDGCREGKPSASLPAA